MAGDMRKAVASFLEQHGPSLPVEVSGAIGIESIIVSAMLSDLAEQKVLIRSRTRVGAVRLYALPSQREALLGRIRSSFLSKESASAVGRLERERLLMEGDVDEREQRALSEAPDFAEPLTVKAQQRSVRCWAWSGLADAEIRSLVERRLSPPTPAPQPPHQTAAAQPVPPPAPHPPREPAPRTPEPRHEPRPAPPAQRTLAPPLPADIPPLPASQPPSRPAETEPAPAQEEHRRAAPRARTPAPPPAPAQPQPEAAPTSAAPLAGVLASLGLEVLSLEEERAGSAYNGLVRASTPMGSQVYALRFRNPKRPVGPTELMEAFLQGIDLKTPVLFVSPSGFSDKARRYHAENFPNFILLVEAGG